MTDADIDRIAERVAEKLWQRFEQHAVKQFVHDFMNCEFEPTHDCFPDAPAGVVIGRWELDRQSRAAKD